MSEVAMVSIPVSMLKILIHEESELYKFRHEQAVAEYERVTGRKYVSKS